MMSIPNVVIILLNYNRYMDTIECISSLQLCNYPSFCIIVIDNSSIDNSVETIRNRFPEIQLVQTDRNLGYTGGINIGICYARQMRPDYILILNNDTIVEPDFLKRLVDAMEDDNNAACACGTIYCYHDRRKIWYAGGHLNPWRGLAVHDEKGLYIDSSSLDEPRKVSFVTGCMILLRNSLLDTIGQEDERFFMYLDDIELSARIMMKRFDLLYVPKAIIYHKVQGEKDSAFKVYYSVRNRLLLINIAFSGISKFFARGYFIIVIGTKLLIWRFINPLFFKAASYGIKDYFTGRFYEGRGISEFIKQGRNASN
jgi:GT2 family glycosyltransferase